MVAKIYFEEARDLIISHMLLKQSQKRVFVLNARTVHFRWGKSSVLCSACDDALLPPDAASASWRMPFKFLLRAWRTAGMGLLSILIILPKG